MLKKHGFFLKGADVVVKFLLIYLRIHVRQLFNAVDARFEYGKELSRETNY